jgi:hypothetical protein
MDRGGSVSIALEPRGGRAGQTRETRAYCGAGACVTVRPRRYALSDVNRFHSRLNGQWSCVRSHGVVTRDV